MEPPREVQVESFTSIIMGITVQQKHLVTWFDTGA